MTDHDERSKNDPSNPSDATTRSTPPREQKSALPDTIGPYKILEVLGEGGMGVVYLAEQSKPVKRRVALKVIKLGMDTKQVVARFEAERQALAMMDHPNVAQVHAGGATEEGRPYFVMENVSGVPITEHCDRHRLNIKDRVNLFMQICDAVQHAHMKGIIHRDLKPSNILISVRDGKAIPKVIDFGVAKALHQKLTEKTLFTEQGQLIGTPEYMSPEQAEMTAQDIDTRSDIYSLGVLLYELLTGALPFDKKTLRKAAFGEIQRIIREVEPHKPSTRFSSLGDESKTNAKNRHTEPRSLAGEIRGDLDWIVMKCLEKDRTRRYDTANGLAEDLNRHLNHEPVSAGPPSAAYKMSKFVRRNRVAVTAAVIVFIVLIAGIVGTSFGIVRATMAEADARLEADKAMAISEFLQTMLSSAKPDLGRPDMLVSEILDQAAQKLADSPFEQPEVQATISATIGSTYLLLGRFEEAAPHLRTALEIRKRVLGEGHVDVAESLFWMGWLLNEQGDYDGAEEANRESISIFQANIDNDNPRIADAMHNLALALMTRGEFDEAERLFREVLVISSRLKGPNDPDRATTLKTLADLLKIKGDYKTAEALLGEALTISRAVHGETHPQVARGLTTLASLFLTIGRIHEAEPLARHALEIQREVLESQHPQLALTLVTLAQVLSAQGDYTEAESMLHEAMAIYQGAHGETPHLSVAITLLTLAIVFDKQEKHEEAADIFADVINRFVAATGPNDYYVANARLKYGACLYSLGRYEESEDQLISAHKVFSEAGLAPHARAAAAQLAKLYETRGDENKADHWQALAAEDPIEVGIPD